MKSALDPAVRRELADRVLRLQPDSPPRWGSMTAPQMVAHLSDCLLMAFGELPIAGKGPLPLRFTPVKQLILYALPFPKGAPTAPELIRRVPADWQSGIAELRSLLDQLGSRRADDRWPEHPAFGRLTGKQWGVLIYRHTDHHLRQFGG